MWTGLKRKNDERRPVHPLVWILFGLVAGLGVGIFIMHSRTPEETPPQTAVQAIVDSVSPLEIQAASQNNGYVDVPLQIVPETQNSGGLPVAIEPAAACTVMLVRTGETFCSIQAAINAATDALDEVVVRGGVYHENLWIENRSITLRGEDTPVLDPVSAATIRVHQGSLTLSDFTLRGHDTGIYITGAEQQGVSIHNVVFQVNPLQGYGFGIMLEGGRNASLNVIDSTFQVGGTAIEVSRGEGHTLNFAHVVFQMPNIVMRVAEASGHHISFTPDVAFQTSGVTLWIERSQFITVDAYDVMMPDASIVLQGDDTTVVNR